jgi:hypothetical protein
LNFSDFLIKQLRKSSSDFKVERELRP